MAGERLSVALRHMEKAYLDENVREYELTKHVSLRLAIPVRVFPPADDGLLRDRTSRSGCSITTIRAITCAAFATSR